MTTTAQTQTQTQTHAPTDERPPRVTLLGVITAEWIKLRSLRSTAWILALTFLSIVVAGAFPAVGVLVAGIPPTPESGVDPTGGALTGVALAQLLVAALGVITVSSEYATGMVRATLTAVPRRLPVLWAKSVVVATVTLVVTFAAALVAFLAAKIILSAAGVSVSLTAPGVLRAIVGSALYLAVSALLGIGFGWLLRSTAGALAGLFVLLFGLPLLGLFLPRVGPYLPNNAGGAIMQADPAGAALPPWVGLAVFAGYAAAAIATAAVALVHRDA